MGLRLDSKNVTRALGSFCAEEADAARDTGLAETTRSFENRYKNLTLSYHLSTNFILPPQLLFFIKSSNASRFVPWYWSTFWPFSKTMKHGKSFQEIIHKIKLFLFNAFISNNWTLPPPSFCSKTFWAQSRSASTKYICLYVAANVLKSLAILR